MHRDVAELKDHLEHIREVFMVVTGDMQTMIRAVKKHLTDPTYDLPTLVDLGFLCREVSQIADELRKEANAKRDLIGKVIASAVTRESLEGTRSDPTVRGKLATGTPDVREIASVPKPGTPAFRELAEFLGLPEEQVNGKLISFRFNGLSDWLTEMASKGKSVPKGINRYTEFKTVFRRRS